MPRNTAFPDWERDHPRPVGRVRGCSRCAVSRRRSPHLAPIGMAGNLDRLASEYLVCESGRIMMPTQESPSNRRRATASSSIPTPPADPDSRGALSTGPSTGSPTRGVPDPPASPPSAVTSPPPVAAERDCGLRHEVANIVLALRLHLDVLEGKISADRSPSSNDDLATLRAIVDRLSRLAQASDEAG